MRLKTRKPAYVMQKTFCRLFDFRKMSVGLFFKLFVSVFSEIQNGQMRKKRYNGKHNRHFKK
jgi:hypothetical protein